MSSILYDDLTSGPLASEIAPYIISGDDAIICNIMNLPRYSVNGTVSWDRFTLWMALSDIDITPWATSEIQNVRSIYNALHAGTIRGTGYIDITDAFTLNLVDYLVGLGLITSDNKNSLIALSSKLISRSDQLGIVVDVPLIANTLRG